jgi:hypothetical protein
MKFSVKPVTDQLNLGVLAVLHPSHSSCLPFTQESHKHSSASFWCEGLRTLESGAIFGLDEHGRGLE